jgi:hypothetical protein
MLTHADVCDVCQANYKAADTLLREVSKTVRACVGSKRADVHPLCLCAQV